MLPPLKRIRWSHAYRIVPSRFPPIGVFDRIADPVDLDAVFALEALTNPRLREQLGALQVVPMHRRISGPGATPVMAVFTHLNPEGSRFSDGSWGVFYAAHTVATAVEETVHHRQRFLAATAEPACEIQMRCYRTSLDSRLHSLRGSWPARCAMPVRTGWSTTAPAISVASAWPRSIPTWSRPACRRTTSSTNGTARASHRCWRSVRWSDRESPRRVE